MLTGAPHFRQLGQALVAPGPVRVSVEQALAAERRSRLDLAASGALLLGVGSVGRVDGPVSHVRRNEDEVVKSVVQLVPVDVVDCLTPQQLATKVLLHDMAVGQDLPAVDGELPIPTRCEATSASLVRGSPSTGDAVARQAAELSESKPTVVELLAALKTGRRRFHG